MDINLLRTFVEVSRTGHFGKAADHLFITQSAVSARIRLLEETLKVKLLTRDRNNIQLTAAGKRLIKHAEAIINTWHRAKQETALDDENTALLTISGTFNTWDSVLQEWVNKYRLAYPHVALTVEADSFDGLRRKLQEGVVDAGFSFDVPDIFLDSEKLCEFPLVMVSTRAGLDAEQAIMAEDYVLLDWGIAFMAKHAKTYGTASNPSTRMNLCRMGLSFLLECGGSAYLPQPMVSDYLGTQLHPVSGAVPIMREVFAFFPAQISRSQILDGFLNLIKRQ